MQAHGSLNTDHQALQLAKAENDELRRLVKQLQGRVQELEGRGSRHGVKEEPEINEIESTDDESAEPSPISNALNRLKPVSKSQNRQTTGQLSSARSEILPSPRGHSSFRSFTKKRVDEASGDELETVARGIRNPFKAEEPFSPSQPASGHQVIIIKEEEAMLGAATASLTVFKSAKKTKELEIDRDTMQSRIDSVGRDPFLVNLDPAIRDVAVTREYMSGIYGGSPQDTFPKIGAEKYARHGLNNFMYLNTSFNPVAPREPGETGLFFISRPAHGRVWPELQRVFVRKDTGAWLYMGQYKLAATSSLSVEEWTLQSDNVRNTWCNTMMTHSWGRPVRASVALRRRLGREPTEAEIEIEEALSSKSKFDDSEVSAGKIMQDFDSGKQSIGIVTMKCMDYDEEFQRRIAADFSSRGSSKTPLPRKSQGKHSPPARKRKASTARETDTDSADIVRKARQKPRNSSMSAYKVESEMAGYVHRGTRSRPRKSQ